MRTRMSGGVGGVQSTMVGPYPDFQRFTQKKWVRPAPRARLPLGN